MAYTQIFDDTKPDIAASGGDFALDTKQNQDSLLHRIVSDAAMNWNFYVTIGSGTAENPQAMGWINKDDTNERLQINFTWSNGWVQTANYYYTTSYWVSYDLLATHTLTYDGNQNYTGGVWS